MFQTLLFLSRNEKKELFGILVSNAIFSGGIRPCATIRNCIIAISAVSFVVMEARGPYSSVAFSSRLAETRGYVSLKE